MPLNPEFVQRISERTIPGVRPGSVLKKKTFSNVSSQMADPGSLPRFFAANNVGYLMPFTDADIPVPTEPIEQQINEKNNVSTLPRVETLTPFFQRALEPTEVRFRTGSMRAWGVPIGLTELRATDAMY